MYRIVDIDCKGIKRVELGAAEMTSVCGMEQLLLKSFSETLEGTAERTSLELLEQVEQTVDALALEQRVYRALSQQSEILADYLTNCEDGVPIEEENLIETLERSESIFKRLIDNYQSRLESAYSDPQLTGGHEESVVDEYSHTIDALVVLHDVIVDLRWAILEFNSSLDEKVGESFTSGADLVAAALSE